MVAKAQFDLERFFQALGDKTRLRLLNLMAHQEICVCYFVEILGSPQAKVSRHLAYLRRAGIVTARREGKWMHYRIAMPPHIGAMQILRQTLATLKGEKVNQADRGRLSKACCAPKRNSGLEGAPLPRRLTPQLARFADMSSQTLVQRQICALSSLRKLSLLDRFLPFGSFLQWRLVLPLVISSLHRSPL
jgi:ArsR family transcriptional regulator